MDGSTKGLPSSAVEKIRKMLAFLEAMTSEMSCGPYRYGTPMCYPEIARVPGVLRSRGIGD
jgi:hypothetical protein